MTALFPFALVVAAAFLTISPAISHAEGRYRILVDEGGVFFQTENDGGWYIPEEDQRHFAPGQSGHYRLGRDADGRYLETEHGRFYLGASGDNGIDADIEAFNRAQEAMAAKAGETKITVVGQHVIVPVEVKHKGRSLELNLLLDTGASVVTLHKDAVGRLRLPKGKTAHFTTAGGHVIAADLVELDEVQFGPYRQERVLAGIIEHRQSAAVVFDGLLGMNALKGIDYRIDYERGLIHWVRDK